MQTFSSFQQLTMYVLFVLLLISTYCEGAYPFETTPSTPASPSQVSQQNQLPASNGPDNEEATTKVTCLGDCGEESAPTSVPGEEQDEDSTATSTAPDIPDFFTDSTDPASTDSTSSQSTSSQGSTTSETSTPAKTEENQGSTNFTGTFTSSTAFTGTLTTPAETTSSETAGTGAVSNPGEESTDESRGEGEDTAVDTTEDPESDANDADDKKGRKF